MIKKRLNNEQNKAFDKTFCLGYALMLVFGLTVSNLSFADNKEAIGVYSELESMNNATKLIEEKKYDEAKNILENIKNKDFEFLKNQHLGDISLLQEKYDEALAYYKIAQINAKDKIMFEFVQKKIQYLESVKVPPALQ